MAHNTKAIATDINQKPIPQYYNPTTDEYEVLQGKAGANRVLVYDVNGNPVDLAALIAAVVNIYNKDTSRTFYGLSTDTKPTSGMIKGNAYFEIDTSEVYMWNGTNWVVI